MPGGLKKMNKYQDKKVRDKALTISVLSRISNLIFQIYYLP